MNSQKENLQPPAQAEISIQKSPFKKAPQGVILKPLAPATLTQCVKLYNYCQCFHDNKQSVVCYVAMRS